MLEYLVVNLRDQRLHWFDLKAGVELTPDGDGIARIRVFPGLWVHGPALFANDYALLRLTLDAGLAMPEHAAFARELTDRAARQRGDS